MINHYFTADLHLGHESMFRHCNPTRHHMAVGNDQEQFLKGDPKFRFSKESVHNHDQTILAEINRTVDENNTVLWILGDFSMSKNRITVIDYRRAINCKDVRLIWGNHDDAAAVEGLFTQYYESTFLLVDPRTGEFLTSDQWRPSAHRGLAKKLLKDQGTIRVQLSHYAHMAWWHSNRHAYHFYGHSHGKLEQFRQEHLPNAPCIDVGWDNFHRPLLLQDLAYIIKKTNPRTPDY